MNLLKSLLDIFIISTRLGLTSFGGPIAHLGYFHQEYVRRRKWMDEESYADLVALSQFLPGPASSQVGIGIGVTRAGLLGGIVSFIGFTLPSVIALILFATVMQTFSIDDLGWIHGLKIVAVVIVLHAILGMAKNLTPDTKRKAIALFALLATLFIQSPYTQLGAIVVAGLIGYFLYKHEKTEVDVSSPARSPLSHRFGYICLALFFGLLILLPIARELTSVPWIALFDSFYRSGSLVFGGGHVVLPLLEQEFVPTGWVTEQDFLAGYGAAQAVPGPLFTFATYLGTIMYGWKGGLFATFTIFLPAFLLILGAMPFWNSLRKNSKVKAALKGVNAGVVGILISALYDPIWTSSILQASDFALAAILFSMLIFWKLPPWVIVLTGALGGFLLSVI